MKNGGGATYKADSAKQNIIEGMEKGGGTSDAEGLAAVAEVFKARGKEGIAALRLGQAATSKRFPKVPREGATAYDPAEMQDTLRKETQRAYEAIVKRPPVSTLTRPKATGTPTPTP